jgi:hypothetical protein
MTDPKKPFPDLDVETPAIPRSVLLRDSPRDEARIGKAVLLCTVIGFLIAAHLICWMCLAGQVKFEHIIGPGLLIVISLSLLGAFVGKAVGRWWIGLGEPIGSETHANWQSASKTSPRPQQGAIEQPAREVPQDDVLMARMVWLGGFGGVLVALLLIACLTATRLGYYGLLAAFWILPLFFLIGAKAGEGVGWLRTRTPWQQRVIRREALDGLIGGSAVGFCLWGVFVIVMVTQGISWALLGIVVISLSVPLVFGSVGALHGCRQGATKALFFRDSPRDSLKFPERKSGTW